MIELKITIPNDEVNDGQAALEKRMAVLGYAFGHKAVPVVGPDIYAEAAKTVYASHDIASREAEAPTVVTNTPRAGENAAQTAARKREKRKPEPAPVAPNGLPDTPGVPPLNISAAPEHRVDPEVEAQDAADEAAEVATQQVKELTAEDLRAVMGQYVTAFGLAEAQADGPKLFADALGTPPPGSEMWSVTLASKNQDTLAKAIVAWNAAVESGKRYGGAA
jgi:hypothetical protein